MIRVQIEPTLHGSKKYMRDVTLVSLPYVGQWRSVILLLPCFEKDKAKELHKG